MSRKQKAVDRLWLIPNDLRWQEFVSVLNSFGYTQISAGRTSGSHRKFFNSERDSLIRALEPHNPRPNVREYNIRDLIEVLVSEGFVDEDGKIK